MTQRTADANFVSGLLEARGPATTPLDAAAEYIRTRVDRVLPTYLLAMTPHAIASLMLIDAVLGEQRSRIVQICIYLTAAMVWRWVWLARLQFDVQQDLRQRSDGKFWRRLPAVLNVRLISNLVLTWGSVTIVPPFYALYIGSFIAPFYFEDANAPLPRLKVLSTWIKPSLKRLWRVMWVMLLLALTMTIAFMVTQSVLANTVLPSIVGIDTEDLKLTIGSLAWQFRLFYFIFLLLDLFWTVAAVFLFYDSQSRRLATDLKARLMTITETLPLDTTRAPSAGKVPRRVQTEVGRATSVAIAVEGRA